MQVARKMHMCVHVLRALPATRGTAVEVSAVLLFHLIIFLLVPFASITM